MRLFQGFDEIEDMMTEGRRLVIDPGDPGVSADPSGRGVKALFVKPVPL